MSRSAVSCFIYLFQNLVTMSTAFIPLDLNSRMLQKLEGRLLSLSYIFKFTVGRIQNLAFRRQRWVWFPHCEFYDCEATFKTHLDMAYMSLSWLSTSGVLSYQEFIELLLSTIDCLLNLELMAGNSCHFSRNLSVTIMTWLTDMKYPLYNDNGYFPTVVNLVPILLMKNNGSN